MLLIHSISAVMNWYHLIHNRRVRLTIINSLYLKTCNEISTSISQRRSRIIKIMKTDAWRLLLKVRRRLLLTVITEVCYMIYKESLLHEDWRAATRLYSTWKLFNVVTVCCKLVTHLLGWLLARLDIFLLSSINNSCMQIDSAL